MKCWCGASDPYYADQADGLEYTCAGTGTLHCLCGGDQCVCHNHGEVACDGCADCKVDPDTLCPDDIEPQYDIPASHTREGDLRAPSDGAD